MKSSKVALIGGIGTIVLVGLVVGLKVLKPNPVVKAQKQELKNELVTSAPKSDIPAITALVEKVDTDQSDLNAKSNVNALLNSMLNAKEITPYYMKTQDQDAAQWKKAIQNGLVSTKLTKFKLLSVQNVQNEPGMKYAYTSEVDVYTLSNRSTKSVPQRGKWEVVQSSNGSWSVNRTVAVNQ